METIASRLCRACAACFTFVVLDMSEVEWKDHCYFAFALVVAVERAPLFVLPHFCTCKVNPQPSTPMVSN